MPLFAIWPDVCIPQLPSAVLQFGLSSLSPLFVISVWLRNSGDWEDPPCIDRPQVLVGDILLWSMAVFPGVARRIPIRIQLLCEAVLVDTRRRDECLVETLLNNPQRRSPLHCRGPYCSATVGPSLFPVFFQTAVLSESLPGIRCNTTLLVELGLQREIA